VFVLASFNAWYFWTQMFVPEFFPASAYQPPLATFVIALAAIATLVTTALLRHSSRSNERKNSQPAPQPLLVGLISFTLGLFWFLLILIAYGAIPALPVVVPLGGVLVMASLTYFLFRLWSNSHGWLDVHRLALVLGIIVATSLGGFVILEANVVFTMSNAPLIDRIGQLAFSIFGIFFIIYLSRKPQFHQH